MLTLPLLTPCAPRPVGPNFGSAKYRYVCSLEEPEAHEQQATYGGSPWGNLAQRAFYVPNEHIGKAWEWAKAHRGDCDVLKHPNTGWYVPRVLVLRCSCVRCDVPCLWLYLTRCPLSMHDDHGTPPYGRGEWVSTGVNPVIHTLEFPCNVPGTGCNDNEYPGPPACGCSATLPLRSSAPWNSCGGCKYDYNVTPPDGATWRTRSL